MNRNSHASESIKDVVKALRDDFKTAFNEIWNCFKLSIMSISNSVILTKIIELICAAVFLISVPEVISFIVKTLTKL